MIAGKVAITGASSGIGEATAEYLARRGARLVLGARGADKLDEVCRRIVDAGGEAECVAIDVARREGAAMLVARAQKRFGRLDVLINNAGVMPIGKLDDLAVDDWERMVDVNIKGVLWGIAGELRATTIFPGYTATNFSSHVRDEDLRAQLEKSGEAFAMPPEAVAAAIAHAIDQPDGVNVGEIVMRSTAQP
jgi:NADP-dependent 3-hydroxy acid dehydrogenase YdfG